MADFQGIAKQFIEFYYQKFDSNRSELAGLYRPHSMLTWEGSPIMGVANITEKLVGLPFEKVVHKVDTQDAQPTSQTVASILVSVTGQLLVDDNIHPLHFSQVFHLMPDETGYFVLNDVFRLNYG